MNRNPDDLPDDDLHDDDLHDDHLHNDGDALSNSVLDRFDEAWIDALLVESFGGPSPPNQTNQILARLHQSAAATTASTPTNSPADSLKINPAGSRTNPPRGSSSRSLTVLAGIAAAVALVVGFGLANRAPVGVAIQDRDASRSGDGSDSATGNRQASTSSSASGQSETGRDGESDADHGRAQPDAPMPRTMLRPSGLADSGKSATSTPPDGLATGPDTPPVPGAAPEHEWSIVARASTKDGKSTPSETPIARDVMLVSRSVDETMRAYWRRLDVTPTQRYSDAEIASLIDQRFGLSVASTVVWDASEMATAIAAPANADALARLLLSAITGRDAGSFGRDEDAEVVDEVRQSLIDREGLDRVIGNWVAPASDDTPTTWSSLVQPLDSHGRLVRTSALLLDRDLRCARCHDVPDADGGELESSQSAYWSFAAFARPVVEQNPDGQPLFYDRIDGRRQMAVAKATPIQPRVMARGLVRQIWRRIHGRPLVGNPYDFSSPPDDARLNEIADTLTDDLMASRFDAARLVALVLTDPLVGRQPPSALTRDGGLLASDEQLLDAAAMVDALAAGPPPVTTWSRSRRIELVRRMLPARRLPGADADVLLAQPAPDTATPIPTTSPEQASLLDEDFLADRATVRMPAWLAELPDTRSRADHVVYLAGRLRTPGFATELVESMRDAGLDESLVLQRLSFVLQ